MKKQSPAAFLPGFTYKERAALLIFLFTLFALLLAPGWLRVKRQLVLPDKTWLSSLVLLDEQEEPAPRPAGGLYKPLQLTPFPFDPNTLDSAGWIRLGLRERTVRTLMRFRHHGGRFRRAEDLDRIYGLSPTEAALLKPWARFAQADPSPPANFAQNRPRRAAQQPLDINMADSVQLEALPGIGPRLAGRIINFRERLGGFCRVEQVAETYGLPDSTFQRILPFLRAGAAQLRQIALNSAGQEELARHPYIRYKLAKTIIAYRSQHGPFRKVTDLLKVAAVDEATLTKLMPYLLVE